MPATNAQAAHPAHVVRQHDRERFPVVPAGACMNPRPSARTDRSLAKVAASAAGAATSQPDVIAAGCARETVDEFANASSP